MSANKQYANGQPMFRRTGDTYIHFLKNGKIKAKGKMISGRMEGEWIFNRLSGQLWQVGNFKHGQKHGNWLRYDKAGNLEYETEFDGGKLVKKLA